MLSRSCMMGRMMVEIDLSWPDTIVPGTWYKRSAVVPGTTAAAVWCVYVYLVNR